MCVLLGVEEGLVRMVELRYSIEEATSPQGFKGSRLSVENAQMYHAGEYKCTTFSQRSHTVYVLSGKVAIWQSLPVRAIGCCPQLTLTFLLLCQNLSYHICLFDPFIMLFKAPLIHGL
ncbi:hypothetical protein E2C01_054826 [Portunus trituberculatus]|uniref:Uncharacterized protein n=1 Tax=Portunus trituberculatus TaxID=210409 RepID=A0A5B7GKM3_PORTR|nr:hypothetical protein [Portunus trituberculatus]